MNWQDLELKLQTSLSKRKAVRKSLLAEGTNAYRFFNGGVDGFEKLVIEVFDQVAVIQAYEKEKGLNPLWAQVAEWLVAHQVAATVYAKTFEPERFRPGATEKVEEVPLAGPKVDPEITILENGLKFAIRPYDGLSSGLFLDQRENRKLIAQMGSGERVLNGFAYTCAFSVACAAQGATVTSVDVSKKALEWGKRNFALNDLELSGHRFFADDMFEYFKRAAKRHDRFDVIIMDPPSFSRTADGKPFSVFRDWRKLLEGAHHLLEPRGTLFFSSNLSKWDSKFLGKMVRDALLGHGRRGKVLHLPKHAGDFGPEQKLSAVFFQAEN